MRYICGKWASLLRGGETFCVCVCVCVCVCAGGARVFPGGANSKEPVSQCRRYKRPGFDPWVGKIPWRRAWQPTPVFLPGESHRQRYLVGLHGVTKTWTGLKQLGMHTHSHDIYKMVRTIIVSRVISIGYFKSRSTNVQHLPQVFIFVNLWRYLLCLPC